MNKVTRSKMEKNYNRVCKYYYTTTFNKIYFKLHLIKLFLNTYYLHNNLYYLHYWTILN